MEDGETWKSHRKALSKMLHLDILNHHVEPMDISAMLFVEVLAKDSKFKSTHEVMDKCARFTYEVICKCLMGDLEHDCQSSPIQPIFDAINALGDMIEYSIQHMLAIQLLNFVPFGSYLFKNYDQTMKLGSNAIRVRDSYVQNQID